MDAENEHELAMREWKKLYAALPETPPLSAPAESLIAQERALRDAELSADINDE